MTCNLAWITVLADDDGIWEFIPFLIFLIIGGLSALAKKKQEEKTRKKNQQLASENRELRTRRPNVQAGKSASAVSSVRQQQASATTPPPVPHSKEWQEVELTQEEMHRLKQARQKAIAQQKAAQAMQLQRRQAAQPKPQPKPKLHEDLSQHHLKQLSQPHVRNMQHLAEPHVVSARMQIGGTASDSQADKGIRVDLSSPMVARNAILFQEILGPPKALRSDDQERWAL